MVKGFNEAWRNSGRKESEISIRYQYKDLQHQNILGLNVLTIRISGE